MKYLSLFSGIGGFELGITQAYESKRANQEQESNATGLRPNGDKPNSEGSIGDEWQQNPNCIGYSEIDKYAVQIYQSHFSYEQCTNCRLEEQRKENLRLSGRQETLDSSGADISHGERQDGRIINSPRSESDCGCKHKPYGDITKINTSELPAFDLLVGGFPCQAFSIAGKRKGFDDTRGTLFFEIARILRDKRPRLFLLENVKGLLSHDNGRTFSTIISTLDELGYDLQWQVLNSKNFGVPQNRERVFIVGHLRGTSRPQVFPIGSTDNQTDGNPEIRQLNQPKHSNDRVYGSDGIAPTLNTMQGGRRQPKIVGGLQGHQTAKDDGIAPCLTTAMGQGGGQTPIVWSEEIRIRRLTQTECERLQGFPDGWTEGVSDTQRYKTLGNAVTVNVIREIIKRMI